MMKYNIYHTAAAISADNKTELRDVLEVMGALVFMLCSMALTIALL